MSFNDQFARALVLDLETVAIDAAADYLEPVEAPSNYVNQPAIDAYVRKATTKALERCSLDPDLCRIVCLGWLLDGETNPQLVIAENEDQEVTALEQFWEAASLSGGGVRRLASFYGLTFDLPVLVRRSQYLNVSFPQISTDKYRTSHLDLHARLTFNGVTKTHSLDFFAKRFALDVPLDMVDGSEIGGLVAEGRWAEVRRHCELDVLKTAALARRLGYLTGTPMMAEAEVM